MLNVKKLLESLTYCKNIVLFEDEARLTNQRGSYAFICSPFTVHVRYILPTFDIKHVL